MRRCLLAACLIPLASAAPAQDLMLFDPATFGDIVLPQREALLGDVQLEAQVGAYNNEFVSNYGADSIFARTGRAVGRLDILTNVGHAPCTAFLVDGNLLVTNHHCVPGILDNPKMKAQGAESIVAVQFKAGYLRDGIEEGVRTFMVDPAPLETNKALDYTVLRVIGDANAEFGALELSAAVPSDRAPLWVIGHPMGEAQRISREKCQADSPAVASHRLRHTCDTLPGNSGSPVIDTDRKQVVGLHHAGSRAGQVNYAVPMNEILSVSGVLKAAAAANPDPDLEAERQRIREELEALRAERDRLREAVEGEPPAAMPDAAPGSLVATPEGTPTASGMLVFAGKPPVAPPPRPDGLAERRVAAATEAVARMAPSEGFGLPADDMGLVLTVGGAGKPEGTVVIDLFESVAPNHAERLSLLARSGAYDGVVFHRVIDDFMAQTGDVNHGALDSQVVAVGQLGTGGSGLPDLKAEFSTLEFKRGVVGMARAGDPDSANSQFFIMFSDKPFLNGQYTVVGQVIRGMEVIDGLKRWDQSGDGFNGEPDVMLKAVALE